MKKRCILSGMHRFCLCFGLPSLARDVSSCFCLQVGMMVDIYQLCVLASVKVPELYPNCILLQVGVVPSPVVRVSRTFARFARLPAVMIWIAYDASCIILESLRNISHNSYYTRLYSDTCIQCLNAAGLGAGAFKDLRGRGLAV